MKYEIIKMKPGDRKIGIRGGEHEFNNFFRIDFWTVGIRFTKK